MRVVVTRVGGPTLPPDAGASVVVDGECVGAIGWGLLVLAAIEPRDDGATVRWMAERLAHLRIFDDEHGRFDRSVLDVGGEALVVSQFTLVGDCRKGRRPSFVGASRPEHAAPLVEQFAVALEAAGLRRVARGRFGAHMVVASVNDGPVTLVIDSP